MNEHRIPNEIDDLIDCLIAISLLTRRMAQDLNSITHPEHEKGEHDHAEEGRIGCCPYRLVRAEQYNA